MKTNVTVLWFDVLKGIGEGHTATGTNVFLKAENIINKGIFKTLTRYQAIVCDVVPSIDNGLYATRIEVK